MTEISETDFESEDDSDTEERYSGTLQYLVACINDLSDRIGTDIHIAHLQCIFQTDWKCMSEEGRVLFHHSHATLAHVFDGKAPARDERHLGSADAYVQLIAQNWIGQPPAFIAADLDELLETAGDCLGASERGKMLVSSEITSLIDFYKNKGWW